MKYSTRKSMYVPQTSYTLQPVYTGDIKGSTYQRKIDKKKIDRIVANFDEHIANEPKLSFRNGEFFVFDGQHTIAARKRLNGDKDLFVLCKVYTNLSAEEEAWLFSQQTGESSKPTPGITLRAKSLGNDQDSIDFVAANLDVGISPSYRMTDGRIVPYFKKLGIPLKELTGDEINAFYLSLRNDGLTGATAQRYHSMMHLAFKQAVKRRVIPTNPCDQADRPKAVQYIGTYYNSAEIKQLLECLDGDPMKIAVILTAYYGLRRSEVLGLKWDAIDPVEDKIYIRHKIIENKLNGNEIEGLDVMKTKSSYRSLPLMPFIKKALEEERARQEEMQRVLRKSYNRKYLDYVCVDAMGDILKPQYVTEHFKVILERNGLKKIRFHDLRHSCASLMLANDISMKEIQEWLGHSNISTTANIYAHVDSESKRESARIIDKVLSKEEAV